MRGAFQALNVFLEGFFAPAIRPAVITAPFRSSSDLAYVPPFAL